MKHILDKKYLAGLFDGEGCLGIHRIQRSKGQKSYDCCPVIKLGMTDGFEIMYALKDKYGGDLYTRIYENHTYKDLLSWTLRSKNGILQFLKEIEPHLIIKNKQARLIRDFYENIIGYIIDHKNSKKISKVFKPYGRLCPNERIRREKLYLQMKQLNQKGKVQVAAETKRKDISKEMIR